MRLLAVAILSSLLVMSQPLAAQTRASLPAEQTLGLTANKIVYTTGRRTLIATGDVEVRFGTVLLRASRLEFDQANDNLIIEGPLFLSDGDSFSVVADYAELSSDLQNGILRSARMILNQQLQISATTIRRSAGRYSEFYQTAASTCTISAINPTPLWEIRAKRIIHDQEARQIYFEGAQMRLAGLPIAYIPRLRLPDPTVKRADGFLVPEFRGSDLLGTGLKIPYFKTLGDYADVTLTPYLARRTTTLQFAFRRNFRNGTVRLNGAASQDQLTGAAFRGYLFGTGELRFASGMRAAFDLKLSSDNSYLSQYGYSDEDRLKSFINLQKTRRNDYFLAEITGFHSLRPAVSNATIPFLLTDLTYRRYWSRGTGQIGLSLQGSTLTRRSGTDGIAGRDVSRTRIALDWQRGWTLGNGMVFSSRAEINGDYYRVNDDSAYASPIARLTPIVAAKLRWPWAKTTARATQVIEPVAQIVYTKPNSTAVPNEDSVQIEFETTNLFALNRFAGNDAYEQGLRANIGVRYRRISNQGWNLGIIIGRVFRAQDLGQFATTPGLAGVESDLVSAVDLIFPSRLKLSMRSLFDNDLSVAKNETRLDYKAQKLRLGTSYVWLARDVAAGALTNRSEWTMDATYDFRKNWAANATWNYDIIAGTPSSAGMAVTYRNECIKVDLSLSRTFTSSINVSPSTTVNFSVALEGFGSRQNQNADARGCSEF